MARRVKPVAAGKGTAVEVENVSIVELRLRLKSYLDGEKLVRVRRRRMVIALLIPIGSCTWGSGDECEELVRRMEPVVAAELARLRERRYG